MTLDIVAFISEVKKYRELWDVNCEDFRFKLRKQRAWAQIARVIIKNFDEKSSTEKNEICKKLYIKWKSVRDTYVRDMRRNGSQAKYIYRKNLAFLTETYKGNQANQSEESEEADEERITKRGRARIEENSQDGSNIDENTFQTSKMEFIDTLAEPASHFHVDDEDRSFFESLLPAVREFSLDQKLDFRSEVINVIKNIRSRTIVQIKVESDSPELGQ